MCDASNFGIGAELLQSHNGTNKMNLISASSRFFTQADLRLSTIIRECTAITYTLIEYEFLILGSKQQIINPYCFYSHRNRTQTIQNTDFNYFSEISQSAHSMDSRKKSCTARYIQ